MLLTTALFAVVQASTKADSERTPLLEVVRMSWSVERDETLLYLRVYSDGFTEADPMKNVDFRHLALKEKQLASEELGALTSLLADPQTVKLMDEYSSFWGNKA
jgi:hypothetical protein